MKYLHPVKAAELFNMIEGPFVTHLLCNSCLSSSQAPRHFSQLSQRQAENLWCLWSGSNSVPQCANPTSASRGCSITAMVATEYILSMHNQLLPSPSLAHLKPLDCGVLPFFLWRICAPSPPLEILSRISLERMARNSRTRACLHAFRFFFFLADHKNQQPDTHNRKSMAHHLEKVTEYSGSAKSGEFYYLLPHPKMVSSLRMHNFRSLQRLKGAFTFTPPLRIMNRLSVRGSWNLILSNKRRHSQNCKLTSFRGFYCLRFVSWQCQLGGLPLFTVLSWSIRYGYFGLYRYPRLRLQINGLSLFKFFLNFFRHNVSFILSSSSRSSCGSLE